jgi:hypothetical protein
MSVSKAQTVNAAVVFPLLNRAAKLKNRHHGFSDFLPTMESPAMYVHWTWCRERAKLEEALRAVEREADDLRRLNRMLEDEIKLIREEHVPVTMQVSQSVC